MVLLDGSDFGAQILDSLQRLGRSLLQPMAIVGMLGQVCFFGRFLVQWVVSERAGRSVVPKAFWYMSIVGSLLVLIYALNRHDGVIAIGQLTGFVVYIRNLVLVGRAAANAPRAT